MCLVSSLSRARHDRKHHVVRARSKRTKPIVVFIVVVVRFILHSTLVYFAFYSMLYYVASCSRFAIPLEHLRIKYLFVRFASLLQLF